jgi:hypothetical protein
MDSNAESSFPFNSELFPASPSRLFPNHYILDPDGEPVFEPDLLAWARWLDDGNRRRIALTDLGARGQVSTVFLGIDHNFGSHDRPVLWESMIFGGPLDQYQSRYDSLEAARQGHATLVESCRALPRREVFKFQLARRLARFRVMLANIKEWR